MQQVTWIFSVVHLVTKILGLISFSRLSHVVKRISSCFLNIFSHLFLTFCSVLCEDEKQAVAVKSQLQQLARPMYSNPPVHGALIVSTVLGDPDLKNLWLKEVKVMHCSPTYQFSFKFPCRVS